MTNHSSASANVTGKSGLTRKAAGYGLALMTLLNFVNYIDRYVLPAVGPRVKESLNLTDTQFGIPRQRVPLRLHAALAVVRAAWATGDRGRG